MHVLITNFDHDQPIRAIKGVRAATGLGLKEAKLLVDRLRDTNEAQRLRVSTDDGLQTLTEHGITYVVENIATVDIRSALARMPQHLTVAEVIAVIDAMA